MKVLAGLSAVVTFGMATTVASAQVPPEAPPPPPPPVQGAVSPTQGRYNVAVLEAVFETAVQRGVQMLREQVQSVMPADMVLLTGAPRARGFRLEGYGVFFDVDVPAISQTIAWTITKMNQNDLVARNSLQQLRTLLRAVDDRRQRDELDRFLRQVAQTLGVPDLATTTAAAGGTIPPGVAVAQSMPSASQGSQAQVAVPPFIEDPVGAYEDAVKKALIDVMLDHSGPLEIGPDELLTVAARDNEDRRLSPTNPYEVATIVMSLKGSDLTAFRTGRITREEAHKRVEIKEF